MRDTAAVRKHIEEIVAAHGDEAEALEAARAAVAPSGWSLELGYGEGTRALAKAIADKAGVPKQDALYILLGCTDHLPIDGLGNARLYDRRTAESLARAVEYHVVAYERDARRGQPDAQTPHWAAGPFQDREEAEAWIRRQRDLRREDQAYDLDHWQLRVAFSEQIDLD